MKTLFIDAKSNVDVTPVFKKIKFEGKLGILTTVQFLESVKLFCKNFNQDNNFEKSISEKSGERFIFGGQILGCNLNNAIKIKNNVDGFLFIGSGDFHPLGALYKLGKPVYVANPLTNKIDLLDKKEFDQYEKRKKAMVAKFLMAKKVGILVSIKPGQFHPRTYLGLKEKMEYIKNLRSKIDKDSYIFIGDNFDLNELENFRDIEVWINTACPRIEGKNLINAEEVLRLNEK